MNPPYGNLANKCIQKALKFSDNIVDLSPILFLEWPKPEKCDFQKNIESIVKVDFLDACKVFCRNPTDLGIIKLNNKANDFGTFLNPFLLRGFPNGTFSLFNKIYLKMPSSFKEHISERKKPLENYSVIYSHLRCLNKNHDFVYTGNVAPDGKTYKEHIKNQHKNDTSHHFEFDTFEEAENMRKYIHSDFFKFIEKITQPGLIRDFNYLPYMSDYSEEWTFDRLKEFFELTDDECNIIFEITK